MGQPMTNYSIKRLGQQGDGIAGNGLSERGEQAVKTVIVGEAAGKVEGDFQQQVLAGFRHESI